MRILFHKLSDDRHGLEIVRDDGRRERIECETRSFLHHDLVHYALETEASLEGGFWGSVARGRALASANGRVETESPYDTPEMLLVERIVGALSTGLAKDGAPAEIAARLRAYEVALGNEPPWLTAGLIAAVRERMRRLGGQWKATPFGGTLELPWPAQRPVHSDGPPDGPTAGT